MSKVCLITGVGPGNGAAFTRRFAREGYSVAMLARSAERLAELEAEVDGAKAYPCDVTDGAALRRVVAAVREDLGPIDVLVHNAGSGAFAPFMDTTAEQLEQAWRINTLALHHLGQPAVEDMRKQGGGSIVVIGATASLRGGANFAAFAQAKAVQRTLAQSMARSLWSEGIHVCSVIIDGMIDGPRARSMEFAKDKPDDFFLNSDDIAEAVVQLTKQPRSAWTFEVDVRPFGEAW